MEEGASRDLGGGVAMNKPMKGVLRKDDMSDHWQSILRSTLGDTRWQPPFTHYETKVKETRMRKRLQQLNGKAVPFPYLQSSDPPRHEACSRDIAAVGRFSR